MNFINWDSMQDPIWDNFYLGAGVSAVITESFNQAHPRCQLGQYVVFSDHVDLVMFSGHHVDVLVHLVEKLCCGLDEGDILYPCLYIQWFLPDQLSEQIKSTIALVVGSRQPAWRWQITKRITTGCGNRKRRKCFSRYCYRTCHATGK